MHQSLTFFFVSAPANSASLASPSLPPLSLSLPLVVLDSDPEVLPTFFAVSIPAVGAHEEFQVSVVGCVFSRPLSQTLPPQRPRNSTTLFTKPIPRLEPKEHKVSRSVVVDATCNVSEPRWSTCWNSWRDLAPFPRHYLLLGPSASGQRCATTWVTWFHSNSEMPKCLSFLVLSSGHFSLAGYSFLLVTLSWASRAHT